MIIWSLLKTWKIQNHCIFLAALLHCHCIVWQYNNTNIRTHLLLSYFAHLDDSNSVIHPYWQKIAKLHTFYSCGAYFLSVFPLKTLPMSRTLPDFGMEGNVWGSHIDSRSSSSRVGAYMLNHCCVWKNLSK